MIINPPLGIYKHLSSLSFLSAGIFADLLVIRLCLSTAYICLIVDALMGAPLWPSFRRPDHLTVDMLLWGILCLFVHMSSVVRLVADEQHVSLTEQEEALWRMFYRVGGLSRKVFHHQIAAHMTVVHYAAGDDISTDDAFHIVYKGVVEIQIDHANGTPLKTAVDGSGCMFDFKNLGLLQPLTSPFVKHRLTVKARTQCICFQFSNADVKTIANAQNTKSIWQNIFIGILARIAVQRLGEHLVDPKRREPDYMDPLFEPLSPSEQPNPLVAGSGKAMERPLAHLLYCMKRYFTPPWPFGAHCSGIRHSMLPAPVPTEGATETIELGIDASDELQALLAVKTKKETDSNSTTGTYESMA